MKKQDLKDGMILETRNGERYLLVNGKMRSFSGSLFLNPYRDDLTYKDFIENDIVKVYEDKGIFKFISIFTTGNLKLIWERKEVKLTEKEVEVLKVLSLLGYEWLARDKDNDLYTFVSEPEKKDNHWMSANNWHLKGAETLFNFIKWEDAEPTKIDNLLKDGN